MPKRTRNLLIFIIILTLAALAMNLPPLPLKFTYGPVKIDATVGGLTEFNVHLLGKGIYRPLQVRRGLDLRGGVQVVLQADMSGIADDQRETALAAARNIVERRVNLFGVTEPTIQTSKIGSEYRVVVELPGVTDTEQALNLIGQTAQLDFRELEGEPSTPAAAFKKTELTGGDLTRSRVLFDPATGSPQVGLEFTGEGAKKFEELTQRNIGKPLVIFLDDQIISAPRVNEAISGGEAVISGDFTLEQAKNLSIQLNAGALPVPVKIISQKNIGATLGAESVGQSLVAGAVGLFLVAFFMIGNYGRLGLIAVAALIVYGLITLALYKLIPVTLTLAGIAGFILSVGMAVDANILIFERMKEETRGGRNLKAAMELGFGRAWDSIRDANICTLITCFVLFNPLGWSFLNTSGMVRGFALTLGLGIFVSLFTGVVVTRTLVRVFYK